MQSHARHALLFGGARPRPPTAPHDLLCFCHGRTFLSIYLCVPTTPPRPIQCDIRFSVEALHSDYSGPPRFIVPLASGPQAQSTRKSYALRVFPSLPLPPLSLSRREGGVFHRHFRDNTKMMIYCCYSLGVKSFERV